MWFEPVNFISRTECAHGIFCIFKYYEEIELYYNHGNSLSTDNAIQEQNCKCLKLLPFM
jgi:hypothetical protein